MQLLIHSQGSNKSLENGLEQFEEKLINLASELYSIVTNNAARKIRIKNKKFAQICSKLDIAFIPFKKVIKEDATFAPMRMALKEKIESIMVSTDENVNQKWLGQKCDGKFIKYIKEESEKGNKIDANNFQTLVVKSPLFKKRFKILKHSIFVGEKNRQGFLKIEKYEFE